MLSLSMMYLLLILEWLLRFYRFLMVCLSTFFLLGIFLAGNYCGFCSGSGLLSLLSLALALLLVLLFLLCSVSSSNLLVASLLKFYLFFFVVRHY
jgi:hypothetical protein